MNLFTYILTFFRRSRLFIENEIEQMCYANTNFDTACKQYNWLVDLITGAATTSELACLEDGINEFEEQHTAYTYVAEMANDLRAELQARYNVLYSQKRVSA